MSSADIACPGDTVVFTCVTDTGQLLWRNDNGDTRLYYSPIQINETAVTNFGIFALKLIHASANIYESIATARNVSLNNDGLSIMCFDEVNSLDSLNNSVTKSIKLG